MWGTLPVGSSILAVLLVLLLPDRRLTGTSEELARAPAPVDAGELVRGTR
jgi:hypothetical protein